MRFTEIPERLKYPRNSKGMLSTLHSQLVEYAVNYYNGKISFKRKICNAMNVVAYLIYLHDSFPSNWSIAEPFVNLPDIPEDKLKGSLNDIFINFNTLEWDLEISDTPYEDIRVSKSENRASLTAKVPNASVSPTPKVEEIPKLAEPSNVTDSADFTFSSITGATPVNNATHSDIQLTSLEDISLNGPLIPCLDTTRTWIEKDIFGKKYCIYYSLPEIPTRQCEISVTTNIEKLSDSDFLRLFPNRRFYTRPDIMYSEDAEGLSSLTYVPEIGWLPKISGFTDDQVLDNIIKYPYVGELFREGRKKTYPRDIIHMEFWKRIEIDGELYSTSAIWSELDDTKNIPKYSGYMAEYVIRRFLLERDYRIVNHQYQMFGTLEPYLVLFMTVDDYIKAGYTDILDIGRKCVASRVSYRRSRNPVIRRIEAEDA